MLKNETVVQRPKPVVYSGLATVIKSLLEGEPDLIANATHKGAVLPLML